MNLLLSILCAFISYNDKISAKNNQFITKFHASPGDFDNPINRPMQIIRYRIKIPTNFPLRDGSIFYGVAGRESLDEIQQRFKLFENTSPFFNNAVIVFVEHRYFGTSKLTISPINSLDDLSDLTMKGALNDNILLIKKLAENFNTYNFLTFGLNYGGLLAGYISDEFHFNPTLSKYKILAWASSTILKYIRIEVKGSYTFNLQLINNQFANLLTGVECERSIIAHFGACFKKIRSLDQFDNYDQIFESLNLNPIPANPIYGSKNGNNELLEFLVFLRNSIKNLAFTNRKFDESGKQIKKEDNVLWKLCEAMQNVPTNSTPIGSNEIEGLLKVLLPDYKPIGQGPPLIWRINPIAGEKLNRKACLEAYQDCTNWQLMSCTNNAFDDPFSNSNWNNSITCKNLAELDKVMFEECQGLFGHKLDVNAHRLNEDTSPRNHKLNFIATTNKDSLFNSYKGFTENSTQFVWHTDLAGTDGLEFESSKECDSDKMFDVRYLVLRAFGCFANLIDQTVCDGDIFNDNIHGKRYSDSPKSRNCAINDSITFPYNHTKIKFLETKVLSNLIDFVPENTDENKTNVETQGNTSKNSVKSLFPVENLPLFILFSVFAFI